MIDPADVVTVSELQDTLRATLDLTQRTNRAVVITQRGKPAGVLLGVEEYRRLVALAERAEFDEDVRRGEEALATGEVLDWEDVKRETLARLGRA